MALQRDDIEHIAKIEIKVSSGSAAVGNYIQTHQSHNMVQRNAPAERILARRILIKG